jgi:predicted Zn finger-like uncharacterized protein
MSGTTFCPNCKARFRVTNEQLASHHGMVRCGQCKEAFDGRINFVPDTVGPHVELPVLEDTILPSGSATSTPPQSTLAEQVAFIHDDDSEFQQESYGWAWATASLLLFLMLAAQLSYYFRVDLAARLPATKPALVSYCKMVGCALPLPRHTDLVSIESSDMQFDPANETRIFLSALLRNRAPYAQGFPNLDLTLNDSLDNPVARRMFAPAEYLPPGLAETAGMQPDLELPIRLHLDTGSLKPTGYRLAIFYPRNL